ncbi:MAG TPA: hypothetical protein VIZ86_16695 [Pseudomonas sp.]
MVARSVARSACGRPLRGVNAEPGGHQGPSLILGFAKQQYAMGAAFSRPNAKTFAELVTFTRSTGGGRFNAAGQFEWLAANEPRFDYDPVTLLPRGLLIEEQRTNLLLESEFRNGLTDTPVKGGLVSAVAFAGLPSGTGVAFGHDGVAPSTYAYRAYATSAGVAYTFSVFVRMDDGNAPAFSASFALNDFRLVVDGGTINPVIYKTTSLGGGLYRVTGTLTSSGNSANVGVLKQATYSSRTFKVTGYHLEAGTFETSYIPTTTAQVTRAADIPSVTAMSPWYRAAEGTFKIEFQTAPSLQVPITYFMLSGGTANRFIYLTTDSQFARSYDGVTPLTGSSDVVGPLSKVASAYSQSGRALSSNGSAPALAAMAPSYPAIPSLTVGGGMSGHIREIRYYPRRLKNSELQAITA